MLQLRPDSNQTPQIADARPRSSLPKLLTAFFVVVQLLLAQHDATQRLPSRVILDHPAPGTSIIRFGHIDAGVYRGSKPTTDADFRFLRSKHVRYVLDIRFLPFLAGSESRNAAKYGMKFLTAPMSGSPIAPSQRHVDQILLILHGYRRQGIYFHCDLGRDRTSLIAALYEMYFLGRSREAAWREMKAYGFKDAWTLRGLKVYFDKHPRPSPELLAAARAQNR
jgi:protein-tyrosine phosphatase